MNELGSILMRVLGFVGLAGLLFWFFAGWWKRSEDRPALAWRWLFTLADLLFLGLLVGPMVRDFSYTAAFIGIPMAAVGGAIMAMIWVPEMTASIGRKFGNLYDGGDVPADPEPFFSIAEARRRLGRYQEAVTELHKQLERFPTHFRGLMMLAEIQAENLNDFPAATETIERLVSQPDHPPKNIAFALTRLADWQLKFLKDPAAAQSSFQRIIERFPDSTEAHFAHQRIAHLAAPEFLADNEERQPIKLAKSDERLGLRPGYKGFQLPPPDHAGRARDLVAQLERFPHDNQSREELALLYAEAFGRLDLATEQFEQLIAQLHAPENHVVRWLNQLAELQVKDAGDVGLARQTLQRILDRFPTGTAVEPTKRRLATLGMEVRAKQTSQAVQLGSYEQRLGLKQGGPPPREIPPVS